MENWIDRDGKLKKHDEEGKAGPRTSGMFGIVKDFYRKIEQPESANTFLGHQTIKTLEGNQRESELQKAKTIAHISRLQTRLI